jgi:hypothetical protein
VTDRALREWSAAREEELIHALEHSFRSGPILRPCASLGTGGGSQEVVVT